MNGKQAKRIRELAYFILARDDEADPIYREYEATESRTKHTQFGPIRVTTPLWLQRDCVRELYQVLKHNYKTRKTFGNARHAASLANRAKEALYA